MIAGTTLKQDMKLLLKTSGQEFCDVFLILDNENDKILIPAHKAVLAARCSYFKDLFLSSKPTTNAFNVSKILSFIIFKLNFTKLKSYCIQLNLDSNKGNNPNSTIVHVTFAVYLSCECYDDARKLFLPL